MGSTVSTQSEKGVVVPVRGANGAVADGSRRVLVCLRVAIPCCYCGIGKASVMGISVARIEDVSVGNCNGDCRCRRQLIFFAVICIWGI